MCLRTLHYYRVKIESKSLMKSLGPVIMITIQVIIIIIIIIIIIVILKQLRKWCKIPEWNKRDVLVS